jgi:hypothetical protein
MWSLLLKVVKLKSSLLNRFLPKQKLECQVSETVPDAVKDPTIKRSDTVDPMTFTMILSWLRRYWWVLLILAAVIYILVLRASCSHKDAEIKKLNATIVQKDGEIASFKLSIKNQNVAVEQLMHKGEELTLKRDAAVQRINELTPKTQEKLRAIYSSKTASVKQLLLDAVND